MSMCNIPEVDRGKWQRSVLVLSGIHYFSQEDIKGLQHKRLTRQESGYLHYDVLFLVRSYQAYTMAIVGNRLTH